VLDMLTVPGHTQDVFVLSSEPADLAAELRYRAAWYDQATLFRGRGIRKFLRIVSACRRVCRARHPDLVICWPTGFSSWLCAGARLALSARVSLLVHCGNPPSRGKRKDWISRAVLWPVWILGGRCVCCSNYVRDLYRSIPAIPASLFSTVYNSTRAASIRCAVEAARRRQDSAGSDISNSPTAIMVATMEAHKDHATLLRALPAIIKKWPTFLLLLVGDGSLRQSLEKLAADLGVDSSVRFVGSSRDVSSWLAKAQVFIFSTTAQEGLGSVLLEALAAGIPIVASDVPACREALENGKWGNLVRPGSINDLADAVSAAIRSNAQYDKAALNEYLNRFRPEIMLRGYLEHARK
jgi:glycosyltransferase involved in cell wall biosynthesis